MNSKDLIELRQAITTLENLQKLEDIGETFPPLAEVALLKLQRIALRNPQPNDSALPVRYFCYCDDDESEEPGFRECTESEFLEAEGIITYKRDTVFANGVNQICLTKDPFTDPFNID